MAKKPRGQWTEAYRKRVERAEAKGLTRQQARGHKEPQEYKRRAAKEIARRGITGDQLRTVQRYANKRAARNKALQPSGLVEWAKEHGWRAFAAYRSERDGLAADYRTRRKAKSYTPQPLAEFKARFEHSGSGGGYSGGGGTDYVRPDYGSSADVFGSGEEDDLDYFEDDWDGDFEDLDIEWMYYHDD